MIAFQKPNIFSAAATSTHKEEVQAPLHNTPAAESLSVQSLHAKGMIHKMNHAARCGEWHDVEDLCKHVATIAHSINLDTCADEAGIVDQRKLNALR